MNKKTLRWTGAAVFALSVVTFGAAVWEMSERLQQQREADPLAMFEDGQQCGPAVGQPAFHLLGFGQAHGTEHREQPGPARSQVIQIVAIDAFDPGAVPGMPTRVTQAHRHGGVILQQRTSPDRSGTRPGSLCPAAPGALREACGLLRSRLDGSFGGDSGVGGRISSLLGSGSGLGGGIGDELGGGRGSSLGGRSGRFGGGRGSVFGSGHDVILLRAGGEGHGHGNGTQGEFDLHEMESPKEVDRDRIGTRSQHKAKHPELRVAATKSSALWHASTTSRIDDSNRAPCSGSVMLDDMSWSELDQVLFAGHLRDALAGVEAALAHAGLDGLVIAAGLERLAFQDDQTYPFRANPWFTWLVPPPAAPGSLLLLQPGTRPRLLFVAPEDYWHSPPEPPREPWVEQFDLVVVADAGAAVARARQIHGRLGWIAEPDAPVDGWVRNPAAVLARLEQIRCRKSSHELACLREASRIGVTGHLAAERCFHAGGAEFDIYLAFLGAVRQVESSLPYPPIVALNEHAATLHYQQRDMRPPARSLSLLIDAGASWRGYASDITRTLARGPGLFATLVGGMNDLQQQLCAAIAPGVDWRELHLHAHLLVAGLLRDLDLLRMDPQAAVDSGVTGAFLPHGLGHLLGVQVHDVGGFHPEAGAEPVPRPPGHPALRLTRRLEAGMVVTVEPGLYFIDSLLARLRQGPHAGALNWPVIERLAPCGGIRIEDDVVVTATGHDNLTRTAFADVG